MSVATWYTGDALEVLQSLPDGSVDLVITSPPFLALRSYLPHDHEHKELEMGSEATPGLFVDSLMRVVEECRRVLAGHGSLCLELGDTFAGGAVGWTSDDKNDGFGMSAERQQNGDVKRGSGWPLPKSLSLIPETVRFTMVYGRNPHTGRETEQWRLRNVVRWCRPNPPVGALGDKYRPATTELMVFAKGAKRFFDLDAVRQGPNDRSHELSSRSPKYADGNAMGMSTASGTGLQHPGGPPPLDYWVIPTQPYKGSHYATWPRKLLDVPLRSMVPRRVCRVCGVPSERITANDLAPVGLAEHITERREIAGMDRSDFVPLFPHYKNAESVIAQMSNWERGKNVPSVKDWEILKAAIGVSDFFDDDVYGERTWTESTIDYVTDDGQLVADKRTRYDRGGTGDTSGNNAKANRRAPDHWSDCGHNNWRNGIVLDPFAGSGTTLEVATGLGLDAIGIDLDERNHQLALQRIGMFLEEGTL